jgi:cytochrome c oxidase cbb3-type subunit III
VTSHFARRARPFGRAGRPVQKDRPYVTALMILGATATLYEVSGFSRALHAQGGPYERQPIDEAAAARGRALYAQYCINCHGSTGKGSDRGPDLIRSVVVLRDRLGSAIGPALARSAVHQAKLTGGAALAASAVYETKLTGGPALAPSAAHEAKLTGAQVVDLSHFLHQRIESIASNRNARAPIDVLTGDPEAGRVYFNGAGTCSTCHSTTGDLAGLLMRVPDPVTLQQRWLFPTLGRSGPRQVDVVASEKTVSGTLVRIDDFSVTLRDAAGNEQSFTRGQGVTVTVRDPLAVHHALLDRYTDADMHNVTTYLWTEGAGGKTVSGDRDQGRGSRTSGEVSNDSSP